MGKHFYIIVLFTVFFCFGSSAQQNLVPNPSFEDTIYCPNSNTNRDIEVKYWTNPNHCTPDYFHSCSSVSNIPNTFAGFQNAYDGNGFFGIATYISSNDDVRDYIQVKLLSPLETDSFYRVSMYVNKPEETGYTTKLGMYLSNNQVTTSDTCSNLPYQVQIEASNIDDEENWVRVDDIYQAKGGEEYLTIGNLYADSNSNVIKVKDSVYLKDAAYYFVDYVSVVKIPDTSGTTTPKDTFSLSAPNIFTPNNDGTNDTWIVEANQASELNIKVFNRWGEQVWLHNWKKLEADTTGRANIAWDGHTLDGKACPAGTYYYLIEAKPMEGEMKLERGYLTLMR